MSPADLVRALWTRMQDRDWDGARATLADDYVSEMPATGELLGPADNYIAMNIAYPEGWEIFVDEVVATGARVVARVRVTLGGKTYHCLSFADVGLARAAESGQQSHSLKILRSLDFWVDDQGEEPPEWRSPQMPLQEREGEATAEIKKNSLISYCGFCF